MNLFKSPRGRKFSTSLLAIPSGFTLFLLFAVFAVASEQTVEPGVESSRIVAVGDVHGNFDGFVQILQRAKVIDQERQWIGGNSILVQTGDILDRGRDVRKVMDLLMSLQKQVPKYGGQVHVLLGNHEAMNLFGVFRDVSSEAMALFAGPKSEKRRLEAWSKWKEFFAPKPGSSSDVIKEAETRWMRSHPLGFFAYQKAMGPKGKYGRWLRQLPVTMKIKETIFLHAGFSPQFTPLTLTEVNQTARREIDSFDKNKGFLVKAGLALPFFTAGEMQAVIKAVLSTQGGGSKKQTLNQKLVRLQEIQDSLSSIYENGVLFTETGPLWFRGYDDWPDKKLESYLPDWLGKQGVRRIVVSHTPQPTGNIRSRLGNKIFLIDTGMLSSHYRGGQASALEIKGHRTTAIYEDGKSVSIDPILPKKAIQPVWIGPDGRALPFRTPQEVEQFLLTADVVSSKVIRSGVNKPMKLLLEKEGVSAHAIFRHQSQNKGRERIPGSTEMTRYFKDSYMSEIAAHKINNLLGMHNMPPTVFRRINEKSGSVQLWIDQAMTDFDRNRKGILPPDRLNWNRQFWDMRVFDNLINNTDRNQGNILIDKAWKLWLIDHTRSFARDTSLPNPKEIKRCSRRLWQVLRQLNESEIREQLDFYISEWEVNALLTRRMELIRVIEALIKEKGEASIIFDTPNG